MNSRLLSGAFELDHRFHGRPALSACRQIILVGKAQLLQSKLVLQPNKFEVVRLPVKFAGANLVHRGPSSIRPYGKVVTVDGSRCGHEKPAGCAPEIAAWPVVKAPRRGRSGAENRMVAAPRAICRTGKGADRMEPLRASRLACGSQKSVCRDARDST
jgi:hypothetical protein